MNTLTHNFAAALFPRTRDPPAPSDHPQDGAGPALQPPLLHQPPPQEGAAAGGSGTWGHCHATHHRHLLQKHPVKSSLSAGR